MEGALVDPGGEVDRLLAEAKKESVKLVKIILTHGHLDHVGGTGELVRRLDLPVEGPHQADDFWLRALDSQAQMMGFSPVEEFVPSRWLVQGDTVNVGEETLDVYHCPGHTPGHVVLFSSTANTAFVGDVLFKGSIGRTDFPQGNMDDLVASIKDRLWPLGDGVRFVPGHGPLSTFGHERKTNPFVADHRYG